MALRNSILALRRGGADVIAFKAAIDELSRLAAGRAEDESLLRQLVERLPELDSGVSRRLIMECHFRDEWRQSESRRVLDSLPSLMEHAEALDQMRDYVALLAPDVAREPLAFVQPWQRELMRQQSTLAHLLKFCPEVSAEAICEVLAEFMDHAQTRLQHHITAVSGQLQQQEPQTSAMGAVATPPSALQGLSAEEFVERLRGQHHAICTIQAVFRGRRHRLAYAALLSKRVAAAVRIQTFARGGAAVRAVRARREVRLRQASAALARRHQAVRLQRAWRWARKKRRWNNAWRRDEALAAAAADKAWRVGLERTQAEARRADQTGFSKYSVYIESKQAKDRKQAEDAASITIQAAGRGRRVRRSACFRSRAATRVQAAWRRRLARSHALWWRLSLRKLHLTRRAHARWRALHATNRALLQTQSRALLVQLNISKELGRVRQEAIKEKDEFEEAFKKWAVRMEKQTLNKKLHADWIPQMDVGSGESYYFNVRTGESSAEHPNMRQVRATARKQRALAEAAMTERLACLQTYESQLCEGRLAQLRAYAAQAEYLWRSTLPWAFRQATYARQ
ncbi:hypothetical protein AB1Y20_012225 [Prymnesium parvum]|uniref:WW domain-containing protein n=1 Tax=Prymnesium parvum TaxID=97485 RepID=A0AB34IQS9_PRYPA